MIVYHVVKKRKAGTPKYTVKKLTGLVLSGVTSFSAFPLRLAFWLGLLVFVSSIIFSGYVVFVLYLNPNQTHKLLLAIVLCFLKNNFYPASFAAET